MSSEVIKCPCCGAKINNTDICEYCGSRLKKQEKTRMIELIVKAQTNKKVISEINMKKQKNNNIFVFATLIGFLIFFILLVFVVLFMAKSIK